MPAQWDVGPKFLAKTLSILKYFALNGPSNKTEIEQRIDPKIDKPTIYKAVSLLEHNCCIELCDKSARTRSWRGRAKYYRITSTGLRELLSRYYGIMNKVSDKKILGMIDRNPHLEREEGWIDVYRALRHVIIEANKTGDLQVRARGIVPLILARDPRLVLFDLIWVRISEAKDGSEASLWIREILEALAPYPSYLRTVIEILSNCLAHASKELHDAKDQLAKIKRVASDVTKLESQLTHVPHGASAEI